MQDLSQRFPVWLCDVWGVLHDGVHVFAGTVDTLSHHRAQGGLVILVSNSPRTAAGVARQLEGLGVPATCHDAIATSGDVTRTLAVKEGGGGIFHLGAERDVSIFEGLPLQRTSLAEAHAVLCTGLVDDAHETPADYAALLRQMRELALPMICANPDKVVRKGARLLYCAGALAEAYAALGGSVLMAGKPFPPIYELAHSEAERLGKRRFAKSDILAIGDGPETDIKGAADYGIATVLVADGVTDASNGLEAAERKVRAAVPGADIVRTVRQLHWS
ncbi:MAG: TIGR01459 family HAD-type hydrolase [Hyphomicrobiales bacterium]